jgi:hypothetical protein
MVDAAASVETRLVVVGHPGNTVPIRFFLEASLAESAGERTMAKTNNGHITGAEQKALNQQENQVSRQIGR